MKSAIELHDSRVASIDLADGGVTVHFSHACIHRSAGRPGVDAGTGWSQAARLIFPEVETMGPLPPLPNEIVDGCLEVGGIRHQLIPLPFRRKVAATLSLVLADGSTFEIVGRRPFIELLGTPVYVDEFP